MKDKEKNYVGWDLDYSPYGPRPEGVHPLDSNFNWNSNDEKDNDDYLKNK